MSSCPFNLGRSFIPSFFNLSKSFFSCSSAVIKSEILFNLTGVDFFFSRLLGLIFFPLNERTFVFFNGNYTKSHLLILKCHLEIFHVTPSIRVCRSFRYESYQLISSFLTPNAEAIFSFSSVFGSI